MSQVDNKIVDTEIIEIMFAHLEAFPHSPAYSLGDIVQKAQEADIAVDPVRLERLKELVRRAHTQITDIINVSFAKITQLPEDLTVGANLDLRGTDITDLPVGLTVGEDPDFGSGER